MIGDRHRVALAAGTGVLALSAVVVPAVPIGSMVGVQAVLGLCALACFVITAFGGAGMSVALLCVVGEIAVAARESALGFVSLSLAGACSLAAAEGSRLCAIWSGRGVRSWPAERLHVVAGARRAAIAGTVALVVSTAGALDLPQTVALAVSGVAAAAMAMYLLLRREA